MRYGLHIPNLAEPAELVAMGLAAEESGWDGVFLWDHLHGSRSFAVPMTDPWVALGALAVRTERVTIGPVITPLARRRPEKVARESVTVDRLSNGRLVLGIGLGAPPDEYLAYGHSADPRELAARLDEGLEVVRGLWTGEPFGHQGRFHTVEDALFLPPPVRGRIPVWSACGASHLAPLSRAARCDGVILAAESGAVGIAPVPLGVVRAAHTEIDRLRGGLDGFDVVVIEPGLPPAPRSDQLVDEGVTWLLVAGTIDDLARLARRAPG